MADQVSATPIMAVVVTTTSGGGGAAERAISIPAGATSTASNAASGQSCDDCVIHSIALKALTPKRAKTLSQLEEARETGPIYHAVDGHATKNEATWDSSCSGSCPAPSLVVQTVGESRVMMGDSAGPIAGGENPTAEPKPGDQPGAASEQSSCGEKGSLVAGTATLPSEGVAHIVCADGTNMVVASSVRSGKGVEHPPDLAPNHYDWAKTHYADLRVPMSFSRSFGLACYRTFTALCRWQEGRMSNKYGRPLPLFLFVIWEVLWLVNSLWMGIWTIGCVSDGSWDRAAKLTVAWSCLSSANAVCVWLIWGWIKVRWSMLMSMVCYTVSVKAVV